MSNIHYQWTLEGRPYTTHADYHQYVLDHVNAIKICPTSAFAEGCTSNSGNTSAAFVLANGASVSLSGGSDYDFFIDWNGDKLPNQSGDDYLMVIAAAGSGSYCGIKEGAVGFPEPACSGTWPDYAVWQALYEWVFK
ncbi:MAG: hypothetical protein VKJ04_06780 [Vampirovibrionales bacterium]|nr:hypothetical protein [Vampirovibrionales bacterium]